MDSGATVSATNNNSISYGALLIIGATNVHLGASADYITVTGGAKDCSIFGGADGDRIYIDNASGVYVDAGSSYIQDLYSNANYIYN